MKVKLTGNEPNLVGYWSFDEGTGTRARDSSVKANNGVLESTVTWVTSGAPLTCP